MFLEKEEKKDNYIYTLFTKNIFSKPFLQSTGAIHKWGRALRDFATLLWQLGV